MILDRGVVRVGGHAGGRWRRRMEGYTLLLKEEVVKILLTERGRKDGYTLLKKEEEVMEVFSH